LNVHGTGGVRLAEMHTAKSFVPKPRASEVGFPMGKLPGVYQIPAEMIQVGGEIFYSEIHKFIKLIWNREELPRQWKE
jgi:hypothetical protein